MMYTAFRKKGGIILSFLGPLIEWLLVERDCSLIRFSENRSSQGNG